MEVTPDENVVTYSSMSFMQFLVPSPKMLVP